MKLAKFKIILHGINKHTLKFIIKKISAKSDFYMQRYDILKLEEIDQIGQCNFRSKFTLLAEFS